MIPGRLHSLHYHLQPHTSQQLRTSLDAAVLAADVTTERREELREAARQIEDGEGVGVEDVVLANDRPVPVVAEHVMTWLGWT